MFISIKQQRKYAVKVLAILNILAVMFLILSWLSYITEHADHRCEGEDCPVCDAIRQCFDNLNTGANDNCCTFNAALMLAAAICLFNFAISNDTAVTLVTQKVERNGTIGGHKA